MYDINFYIDSFDLYKNIQNGKYSLKDKEYVFNELEKLRNKNPIIYNIETTNNCLHKCHFCPRTTKMTRSIKTMKLEEFENIISQIKPWTKEEWNKWKLFAKETYNIEENEMSENHFFLYIISNVIQLHCYGDDLLNKNIDKFVKILSDRGFNSYFSTNPTNMNIERVKKCFENGLSYIKFSIESVKDELHQKLRGNKNYSFQKCYEDIYKLFEFKKQNNFNTTIVITMLDFNSDSEEQEKEFLELKKYFNNKDFYIYKKSLDTQWYMKDFHPNKSIHWNMPCKHPWISMTILSNGQSAECMESYNGDIYLGNIKEESLYNIWNGEKYKQFRKNHIELKNEMRCLKECDMKLIGESIK